jgi:hypothetical protein
VIEVEATEEILVGFSLATALRDDDARHRLEHFTLPHERSHIELPGGDGALARRGGDADKVFRWILDIREVGERALAHDDDFRVERKVHDFIVGHDLTGGHRKILVVHGGEVDEAQKSKRPAWH